jgi:lipopolysaccharide/colanic/teichoic acid biosynthesis glycosyltransferase
MKSTRIIQGLVMKTINCLFIVLASILLLKCPADLSAHSTSTLQAKTNSSKNTHKPSRKIYIQVDQIKISKDYIVLKLPQGTITALNLHKDAKGYYIFEHEVIHKKAKEKKIWRCPHCKLYITDSAANLCDHVDEEHSDIDE